MKVELQEWDHVPPHTELPHEACVDVPRCIARLLKLQPRASEEEDGDDGLGQLDAAYIDHHLVVHGHAAPKLVL